MITTDLERSKKLAEVAKKKGYKLPESYFVWKQAPGAYMDGVHYFLLNNFAYLYPDEEPPRPERIDNEKIVRTYTLDELLAIMPSKIVSSGDEYWGELWWTGNEEKRRYYFEYMNPCNSHNPCNAACDLLIWLIEGGYIK